MEREESCFTRAARAIRRALARICRDRSASPPAGRSACPPPPTGGVYSVSDQISRLELSNYVLIDTPPPKQPSAPQELSKRKDKSPGGRKQYGLGSFEDVYVDEVFGTEHQRQDVAIAMGMDELGSPPRIDHSYPAVGDPKILAIPGRFKPPTGCIKEGSFLRRPLRAPKRKDREDGGPRCKTVTKPSCSQSITPTVDEPLCAQGEPAVVLALTGFTEADVRDAFEFSSTRSESKSGGGDYAMEMEAPVVVVKNTVTNALPAQCRRPPPWSRSDYSRLSRSRSTSLLSRITSVENEALRRAESSPDMLRSSFEDFTPDIAADENDETYRFQCTCPGLYRCSVTGLLFHMAGEGVVVYRTIPWDRRLLARHRKKPAGPLFDIKCEQQSVRGLHLPHCEIRCTGGCDFLSVAHAEDEGVEFIGPQAITETHIVVNIAGLSAYGNVKDEDSPPHPARALVLLFYRPPTDPHPECLLNVLLLPRNVVLRDVLHIRKKSVGDESYIETSPHCKLNPGQEYTLSTLPEDDQVLVQPTEAEFESEDYDNYFPSFQVTWETTLKHIRLLLRDANSSQSVWERQVCLSSAGGRRSCGPSALDLSSPERLLVIRTRFVEGISGPVLKSLLDKLLEKTVMTDAERESADAMPNNRDKARFVIDTVRKKGEAAGSEMIEILEEADPTLYKHLKLI